MSPVIIGLIGLAIMLLLMFSGMNLAFAFMIAGYVGVSLIMGFDHGFTFLRTIPVTTSMSYTFAILPLFMLMGDMSVTGRLTTDAYNAARHWFGHLSGGLAITSTIASALFGAICGSGQATAMVMSQVAWPEMKRYNYHPGIGLSSIAAAGPLAILIPPSTPLILYGVLSGASIGDLFLAGWGPGILLTVLLSLTTVVLVKINPAFAPRVEKSTIKEKLTSLKSCWSILLLVIIIMYCIWGGVTTVNEAAGVAAIICIIIVIAKRRANAQSIIATLKKTAVQASGLFFMFIGIQIFNVFLVMTRLPAILTESIQNLNIAPIMIILLLTLIYLVLGCFIDTPVLTMLTIPLFAPMVAALGFDLVWFGIIHTMCVALGSITPPVGICLFVISAKVPEVSMGVLMKWIWPYVFVTAIATVMVIFLPEIALFLPGMM